MKYHHHWIVGIVAITGSLFAPALLAQQSWLGVSGGSSETDEFCDGFGFGFGIDCDDTDTGIKAFIGADITPHFGIEAFWADLGEASARNTSGDSVKVEVDGIGFSLLPTLPVSDDFQLFGKIGLFTWDAEAEANISGNRARASDDGSDPFYGFGARLFLGDQFALRAEWERYDLDGDEVTLMSAGAEFRF